MQPLHSDSAQGNGTGRTPERSIIWLQRDAMGSWNPAIKAHPDSPVFFCFDDAWIQEENPSQLRLDFMTRCATSLGATVISGVAAECLSNEARKAGTRKIVTTVTPCRHSRLAFESLNRSISLEIMKIPRIVDHDGPFDLRSFSRFWKDACAFALPPSDPS
ncbi:MAG: hypothetical protein RIQ81_555 [Pseudomonadota bacterium]|jgi:hypothetical protein